MARKLTMGLNWQGKLDFKAIIERVKIADEAGIHSMWIAEAWGTTPFTLLTLLAEHTKKIHLGTSIVNIYSRTPAALAQHFGTLDELSGGRMIIGLGTSGPQVIEHFHGIKFNPPLTRLKEYVDIINLIMAGTPLNYNGKIFKLGAASRCASSRSASTSRFSSRRSIRRASSSPRRRPMDGCR